MEDNAALRADVIEQAFNKVERQAGAVPRTARPLVVVADSSGFVGAFTDERKAKEFALPYTRSGVPLIMYRSTLSADADQERVFVIPYRSSDAVAFVSNDIALCRTVHATLDSVGLTYGCDDDDALRYWEHPVDVPCAPAVNRLKAVLGGIKMCEAEAKDIVRTAEEKEKQLFASDAGPLERHIMENERLTILDCVVPIGMMDAASEPEQEESHPEAVQDAVTDAMPAGPN
jgi:hypothetical protein